MESKKLPLIKVTRKKNATSNRLLKKMDSQLLSYTVSIPQDWLEALSMGTHVLSSIGKKQGDSVFPA